MGCALGDAQARHGSRATDVFQGHDSDASENYTVYLRTPSPSNPNIVSPCGGTLVDRKLVVTARHCINEDEGGLFGQDALPASIEVYGGGPNEAERFRLSPVVAVFHNHAPALAGNDLAVLVLRDAVYSIPSMVIAPPREVTVNEILRLTGWGPSTDTAITATTWPTAVTTRQSKDIAVTEVSGDGVTLTVTNGICSGDSGGPNIDANEQLLAIVADHQVELGEGEEYVARACQPTSTGHVLRVAAPVFRPVLLAAYRNANVVMPWWLATTETPRPFRPQTP